MKANYQKCLKVVLAFEGGYSNHPKDPGGATNFGITQAVYDSYRRGHGKPVQSVRKIAQTEVETIYRVQYWDAIRGDRLPYGVDLAIFDYAVNSGVPRAVRSVQKVLSAGGPLPAPPVAIKQDGQLGLSTESAIVAAANYDEVRFIELYCEDRWSFVQKLRTFSTFGKGWKRRIQGNRLGSQDNDVGVIDIAVKMAVDDLPKDFVPIIPKDQQGGKAKTEDVKVQATAEGTASGTAGTGAVGAAAVKFGVGQWVGNQIISLGELAGFTKDQLEPYVSYSSWIGYAFIALGIFGVIGMVAIRIKKQREGSVEV